MIEKKIVAVEPFTKKNISSQHNLVFFFFVLDNKNSLAAVTKGECTAKKLIIWIQYKV